jgi:hypothetical protein
MRICNRSDRTLNYELRGGPLRMTLSTCDLEPGEDEEWTPRYRVELGVCVLILQADGERKVVEVAPDATVIVTWADGMAVSAAE